MEVVKYDRLRMNFDFVSVRNDRMNHSSPSLVEIANTKGTRGAVYCLLLWFQQHSDSNIYLDTLYLVDLISYNIY